MRKIFLIVMLISCYTHAPASGPEPALKPLRQKMQLAVNSKKVTDSLYDSLDKMAKKPAIIMAYMGTLDALKAKHNWNPYSKIKDLNLSQNLLQKAVADEPHNMEIRFLRFSIQHNVPGFLGFGKNLAEDKQEILNQLALKNYDIAEKELVRTIITFLLNSKRCTAPENEKLHQYLANLK